MNRSENIFILYQNKVTHIIDGAVCCFNNMEINLRFLANLEY